MVAAGKGNATIAHELMISLKTVRNHVSNIFTKLQVSDRSAAIVKAREAGLGGGSGVHGWCQPHEARCGAIASGCP